MTKIKDDVQSKEEGKGDDKVEEIENMVEPIPTTTQPMPKEEEEKKEEPTLVVDESQTEENMATTTDEHAKDGGPVPNKV